MLSTYRLVEFIRPADRGACAPFVGRGVDIESDAEAILFIKTRAGYGDRPAAAGVELFTTLLAREFGLHAPKPDLVLIPERFAPLVYDAPRHAALIDQSAGTNFATHTLGPDWKVWIPDSAHRAFPDEALEDLLIFDALVQHTDRAPHNPNLLWKGKAIAPVDHEGCLAHLTRFESSEHPWRDYLGLRPFHSHCLLSEGKRLAKNASFGRSFCERMIGLEFSLRHRDLASIACHAFPSSKVVLDKAINYLDSALRQHDDFLDYVKLSLSS